MHRPQQGEYNPYFQKYIDLVPGGNYNDILKQNSIKTIIAFKNMDEARHNYAYAPGKWTVKQLLMHIMDTERVMAYRALAALRGDSNSQLCAMDENAYAQNADTSKRNMEDMLEEFAAIRRSTEKLFEHVNEDESQRSAKVVNHSTTARALGYIIVGHAEHHINVLNERYL